MRRSAAALSIAGCALLFSAAPSHAATCTGATAPLQECTASATLARSPMGVTTARKAHATGDVGHRFVRGTIEQACLDFGFSDPLGPGEWLRVYLGGRDTGGFENVTGVAQSSRTICWKSDLHPEVLSHFTDGREHIGLQMQKGKVVVGDLVMRVTGVDRGPS